METFNLALVTKRIYDSGLNLLTSQTLKDIIGVKTESTFYSLIRRLLKSEILVKIEKNKYLLKSATLSDFALANFLCEPSYISLESALNFHGILSQFPYELTSCTLKKSQQKVVNGKLFGYIHLKKSLFWGYEKRDNFLIALPEKALLDQAYLASKGLRSFAPDEYNFEPISKSLLKKYLEKYPASLKNILKLKK